MATKKYIEENLFTTVQIGQKKFKNLLEKSREFLQEKENLKELFKILDDKQKATKFQSAFKYFVRYFNFLRIFIDTKKNGLNTEENIRGFLQILLTYIQKYISVHVDDSQKVVLKKLMRLFSSFKTELIIETFQKQQGSLTVRQRNLLIYIIINIRKQPESIQDFLVEKLTTDYLIDIKKQTDKGFKFTKMLANAFTEKVFQEKILSVCQKLLRRSDSNIKIFLQILMCNIDFSEVAEEICFKNLKEYYKNKDLFKIAIVMANRVASRSGQHDAQIKLIKGFEKLIDETNSEDLKFEFLCIIANIALQVEKKDDEIILSIFKAFTRNLICIKTEAQYIRLYQVVQKVFSTHISENFKLTVLSDFQAKIPQAKGNKYAGALICQITSQYIQKHGDKLSEDEKKELVKFGETIFNDIFKVNLKDYKKLVTNSIIFCASLELSCCAMKYSTDLRDSIVKTLPDLLSTELFTNGNEFFTNNSKQELTLYLSGLSKIYYAVAEDNDLFQKVFGGSKQQDQHRLIQNIITYLIVNSRISSEDIEKFFEKGDVRVFKLIQDGLFYYFYLIYPQNIEQFDTLLHKTYMILNVLVKQLKSLGEKIAEIGDLSYFNFLVYNSILSKPLLQQKYVKIIEENKNALSENLKNTQSVFNGYLLNSSLFIQHKQEIIREGTKGIAQMLMNLGQLETFLPYKIFLNKQNQTDSTQLTEFVEKVKAEEKGFLKNRLSSEKIGLISIKVLKPSDDNDDEEEEEEIQVKKGGDKKEAPAKGKKGSKKGGKPPYKSKGKKPEQSAQPQSKEEFIMLDEEQLLQKQLRELKAAMVQQYNWSVSLLSLLGTSTYKGCIEFFFIELLDGFISVCNEQQFQKLFLGVSKAIFGKIDGFSQYKEGIAEFLVKYCENEVANDKVLEKFFKFQEWLINKPNFSKDLPEYIVKFCHMLQKFIVSRGGFDMRMKEASMEFYIKLDLSLYKDLFVQIYTPFNQNLNILSSQRNAQDLLDKLMKNMEDIADISKLFKDILNNVDKAKSVVLNTLIQNQDLPFQPSFDDIIKLKILMIDDNQDVRVLAEKTLNNFPHELSTKKIESFDLETFALDHSRENSEKFTELAHDILKNKPDYNKVFFKILVRSATSLYDNEEISEESLLFYSYFLTKNMEFISGELLEPIFTLLVEKYTGDSKEMVSAQSLKAGIEIIKFHGARHSSHIITILEKFLKSKDDQHQLSTIIFLGVIAPHIKNKSQVEGVSQKIMILFEKGSENMQRNLAKCMPELINFFENPKKQAISALSDLTYHSNFEMKRGCSYLIAGLNKGLGVEYIKDLRIFETMKENCDLKKDKGVKQSVLLLVSAYLDTFERVIEPYIIQIVDIVMLFFTDRLEEIRELALATIKLMMKKLTAYGVKIVLPQMLKGLEEPNWQAKVNNIWSLGNMAYCSPKQLSQCLPQIVPKLSACLSDTHPSIREASNDSLNNIGSTIQNPEISEIVDILIQALSDPFEKNKSGLEVLLQTKFEHYIDAPSLSLVIPILDYALKQRRDPEAKMDACQVIGSISTLIKDISDLIPYMQILVEGLSQALADPDGGVRTFGAKAVGKLAEKLSSENTEKFFKFVIDKIEEEHTPSIERGGCSSALAEIMVSLGHNYFTTKLQEIFNKMKDDRSYLKEGYIGIFVFLPNILKDKFKKYIKIVLENTVEFVTHYNDKVRDITLRVLKILIQNYGIENTDLLMQPINEGMFSTNWRKRNSTLVMSGEMLEVLSKYLRVPEGEEYTKDQLDKISYKNENVMGVYILRGDEVETIRLSANNVWKTYIENTPKTLKQGLSVLFDKMCTGIMRELDIQVIIVKSLLEFSSRYGESFFPQIIDEVERKQKDYADDLGYITGLVLVIREILLQQSYQTIVKFKNVFIELIKKHLFTQDRQLREAIFKLYKVVVDKLQDTFAQDQIIGKCFQEFSEIKDETDPQYNVYLDIFNNICKQQSQKILEYLLPILFKTPLKIQQIDIITNNAEIIGKEVYNHVKHVEGGGGCEIMLEEAFKCEDKGLLESIQYCLEQLSVALGEEDIKTFFEQIILRNSRFNLKIAEHQKEIMIVLSILNFYYYNTAQRINDYNDQIIQQLIPYLFLGEEHKQITILANKIFQSFYGQIERKLHFKMVSLTTLMFKQQIEAILDKNPGLKKQEYMIRGFNTGEVGEGIAPYIEMIISCLVYNSEKEFDEALDLIDYLITHSELENLNVHIMKIVGPLIRVINYKYEQERKERIIEILHIIKKKKMRINLFSSQLQSTYLKLISEFPREQHFLKNIAINMLELLEFTQRKDIVLHDVYHRFNVETNQIVKEAYLYVLVKYIKIDVVENKGFFARGLLEKLFENFQKITHKDDLNNNILFFLVKIIGYLSNYASFKKIKSFQQEMNQVLSDAHDIPPVLFFSLANLLAVYNYNSDVQNGGEGKEEWKEFAPLENIQGLLKNNIGQFAEKEWVQFLARLIKKNIKKQNKIGKFLGEKVVFPELLESLDPQLLEFEDVKKDFE